jgi:hypothetical protein
MKAISTHYLGPTDYRGSRIVATAEGGDRPHKVTIPYPHELSGEACFALAAEVLCRRMGWTQHGALVGGGTDKGYVFVFDGGSTRYPIGTDTIEIRE